MAISLMYAYVWDVVSIKVAANSDLHLAHSYILLPASSCPSLAPVLVHSHRLLLQRISAVVALVMHRPAIPPPNHVARN